MSDTRIALVTGANKGIGLETARRLGEAGVTVLLGARDPDRGTEGSAAEGAAVVAGAELTEAVDSGRFVGDGGEVPW